MVSDFRVFKMEKLAIHVFLNQGDDLDRCICETASSDSEIENLLLACLVDRECFITVFFKALKLTICNAVGVSEVHNMDSLCPMSQ